MTATGDALPGGLAVWIVIGPAFVAAIAAAIVYVRRKR